MYKTFQTATTKTSIKTSIKTTHVHTFAGDHVVLLGRADQQLRFLDLLLGQLHVARELWCVY